MSSRGNPGPVGPSSSEWWRWYNIRWWINRTYHDIWWRFMPGTVILVPWPGDFWSGDPDRKYRDWLIANVGRQCWDWDWDIHAGPNSSDAVWDLKIKFRRGKEKQAVLAALMWS